MSASDVVTPTADAGRMVGACPESARLQRLARECPWLMQALEAARPLMSAPWCIAAGAVRSLVWNSLHGFTLERPREIDLVFFDPSCDEPTAEAIGGVLSQRMVGVQWDVVNQAHAHTLGGDPDAPPFSSLEHALSCWPETATAVGLCLDADGALKIVAPLGLTDLFGLVLRPSPLLRRADTFGKRLSEKRFVERWPLLRVVDDPRARLKIGQLV